jgi:hypothetical protein
MVPVATQYRKPVSMFKLAIFDDRRKLMMSLVLAGVVGCLALVLFIHQLNNGDATIRRSGFLLIILLALVPVIYVGYRRLIHREPHIEILPEGLRSRDVSPDIIPWKAIRLTRTRKFYGLTFLEIELNPDDERRLKFFAPVGFLRPLYRLVGIRYFTIRIVGLEQKPEVVLTLVEAGRQGRFR